MGLACLAAALPAAGAMAREPVLDFNIRAQPLNSALIDFAIQANVSIGSRNGQKCLGGDRGLKGQFTIRAGLQTLLAQSNCGYRQLDTRAFELIEASSARRQSSPTAPSVMAEPPAADIVVFATRHPARIDRLAYAVSALKGDSLAEQGVEDASGLALVTPSMTVTNLGMGRDKILLRGLSDGPLTGRTQSMTGLYLDDVRLTFNAPDPDLRLTDIDQVEVLRGPQGSLYGAGSIGGVVHIITVQPDTRQISGWAETGVGFTQGGAPSDSISGALNLPLADGRAAARLVLYREVQGGYIKDTALKVDNANRSERDGVRLAFKVDLPAAWTATAGVVAQAINSNDTQYVMSGGPGFSRNNQVLEPHDNDFDAYHLGLKGDLGWGQAQSSLAYVQHSLFSRYDATAAPPTPVPPGPVAFDDKSDIDSVVAEQILSSRSGDSLQWLAGAFFAHTRETEHSVLSVFGAAAPLTAFAQIRTDSLDEAAIYGEGTAPLTSRLGLTIGGRLFWSRDIVASQDTAPTPLASPLFQASDSHIGFAPKVVIFANLSPKILIYVQAGEGYRAGGINTLSPPGRFGSVSSLTEPTRYYRGDELWNFETGAKLNLEGGRLHLRLAAFEAVWKDVQSDQLLASGLPFSANIGDARNRGLEFEGDYRVGGLQAGANLLVNEPELIRANPALPALQDRTLGVIPAFSLGVSGRYSWSLADRRAIQLEGRWGYVGSSRLALATAPGAKMGNYATGRLATALVAPRWRLTLALDNPANVRGDTFAFGNPFTLRTAPQVTPLRPRTASLTLKISY
jgi:outer membrane receptor protein involved in Fe transport